MQRLPLALYGMKRSKWSPTHNIKKLATQRPLLSYIERLARKYRVSAGEIDTSVKAAHAASLSSKGNFTTTLELSLEAYCTLKYKRNGQTLQIEGQDKTHQARSDGRKNPYQRSKRSSVLRI